MKTSKICLVILCLLPVLAVGLPQFLGATSFMKEIQLTRGLTTTVDDEDYEFLNQWKWQAHGKAPNFYAYRGKWIEGKKRGIHMHRLVMGVTDPIIRVDHKDMNPLNNQKSNLRPCTISQNNANSKSRKGSGSKYIGVCPYRKKPMSRLRWRATIGKDKKVYHIGFFDTQEEAALAYNNKAIELHGEFANLNIIP